MQRPQCLPAGPGQVTIIAMTEHPDRVLPLQGASNFRDLGGYLGQGGRDMGSERVLQLSYAGSHALDRGEELGVVGK